MGKARAWIWVAAATAMALIGAAQSHAGDLLLYNHSASITQGFYVRTRAPIGKTSIVTVRAADVAPAYARLRHFTGATDRFIKRVAAIQGDEVCATGAIILVNGRESARRQERDSDRRVLPSWSGCRRLAGNEVFLLGDTDDSFDGRYWGVITREKIEGVWRPLGF